MSSDKSAPSDIGGRPEMPPRLGHVLRSWWTLGSCSAAAVALVAGFICGPAALLHTTFPDYADVERMPAVVTAALNEFLSKGGETLPAELARLAEYWFLWHAIKVAICVPMLLALKAIAAACWTRWLGASGRRAAFFGVAASGAAVCAVLAAWLLAANIQATAVPLVALLPMVSTVSLTEAPRADTAAQASAVTELMAQVSSYHWVLGLVATALAVLSMVAAIASWRCRMAASATGRPTVMYTSVLTLMSLNAIAAVGLAVYSVVSALDPAGSLNAILGVS